jgi:hypothetical protein
MFSLAFKAPEFSPCGGAGSSFFTLMRIWIWIQLFHSNADPDLDPASTSNADPDQEPSFAHLEVPASVWSMYGGLSS